MLQILGTLLRYQPMRYNYTVPVGDPQHCYNLKPVVVSAVASGLVLDASTWIMPHFVVWSLQLSKAHKIAITAIFGLGLLYCLLDVPGVSIIADHRIGIFSLEGVHQARTI